MFNKRRERGQFLPHLKEGVSLTEFNETLWYDTDEEAEEKLAKIVKDYDLKWFDTGFYKGGRD